MLANTSQEAGFPEVPDMKRVLEDITTKMTKHKLLAARELFLHLEKAANNALGSTQKTVEILDSWISLGEIVSRTQSRV